MNTSTNTNTAMNTESQMALAPWEMELPTHSEVSDPMDTSKVIYRISVRTVQAIVLGGFPHWLRTLDGLKTDRKVNRLAVCFTAVVQSLCAMVTDSQVYSEQIVGDLMLKKLKTLNVRNTVLLDKPIEVDVNYLIDTAIGRGWLNDDFTLTDAFLKQVELNEQSYPDFEPGVDRNIPFVKNGTSGNKNARDFCINLNKVGYQVHERMLSVVANTIALVQRSGKDIISDVVKKQIKRQLDTTRYVREACAELVSNTLFSKYDMDNRARGYHVGCAGPNPQAGDEERSYYSLVYNQTGVLEGSVGFDMFMGELKDIAGGFATTKRLAWVAANPEEFLTLCLVAEASRSKTVTVNRTSIQVPKKPMTLIRLAWDYQDFTLTGLLKSTVGFGLDAKCSGTQYYAFCAGDLNMAIATGLTTSAEKVKDPYQQSLEVLEKLIEKSELTTDLSGVLSRDWIKTPYMMVQYGGGAGAIYGDRDWTNSIKDQVIMDNDELQILAKECKKAVEITLGKRIINFRDAVEDAVQNALWVKAGCKMETVTNYNGDDEEVMVLAETINYKHVDGFVVKHKAYGTEFVSKDFSINLGGFVNGEKCIDFGTLGNNYRVRTARPTGAEYVRTFCVNFIQGLDALVARTVVNLAAEQGLQGITSIHDCFRVCLEDADKLQGVIAQAYKICFIDNDPVEHLAAQLGGIDLDFRDVVITEEILNHENSYYFCQ